MIKDIYLTSIGILFGFGVIIWFLNKKISQIQDFQKQDSTLSEWLKTMQSSIEGTNKTLNQVISQTNKNLNQALATTNKNVINSLQSSTKTMNERLDNAAKYIADVAKEVGQMSELGKSMRELQVFLQSPKLRGNIGEQVLKDLITQIFPKNSFFLQYSFKSGEKVDAAIKTSAGILPIDSKFPMENFKRMKMAETKLAREASFKQFRKDVKKHIVDIAKKYILTDEGTLDFAFMYLPSEAVFNEVSNDISLLEFARQHRIYPVSPNTLYVHLQTVLLSFEGQKIEVRSRRVFRLLRAIQKDYQKTEGTLQVLGKHINNAYNQFANSLQYFSLMGQKLNQTQLLDELEESKLKKQN